MDKYNKRQGKSLLIERIVKIRRVSKVVKGGRRFGFSTVAIVGDGKGNLGIGLGKALEVSESVRKAITVATKSMSYYKIYRHTIPHETVGYFCGGKVLMKPAAPGSGIIASGSARMVVEAVGIKDINIKALGSRNPQNVVKATINGLSKLRTFDEVAKFRGKNINEINLMPY